MDIYARHFAGFLKLAGSIWAFIPIASILAESAGKGWPSKVAVTLNGSANSFTGPSTARKSE
jgi:hypothetical protein